MGLYFEDSISQGRSYGAPGIENKPACVEPSVINSKASRSQGHFCPHSPPYTHSCLGTKAQPLEVSENLTFLPGRASLMSPAGHCLTRCEPLSSLPLCFGSNLDSLIFARQVWRILIPFMRT
jgi:hypothetical protein